MRALRVVPIAAVMAVAVASGLSQLMDDSAEPGSPPSPPPLPTVASDLNLSQPMEESNESGSPPPLGSLPTVASDLSKPMDLAEEPGSPPSPPPLPTVASGLPQPMDVSNESGSPPALPTPTNLTRSDREWTCRYCGAHSDEKNYRRKFKKPCHCFRHEAELIAEGKLKQEDINDLGNTACKVCEMRLWHLWKSLPARKESQVSDRPKRVAEEMDASDAAFPNAPKKPQREQSRLNRVLCEQTPNRPYPTRVPVKMPEQSELVPMTPACPDVQAGVRSDEYEALVIAQASLMRGTSVSPCSDAACDGPIIPVKASMVRQQRHVCNLTCTGCGGHKMIKSGGHKAEIKGPDATAQSRGFSPDNVLAVCAMLFTSTTEQALNTQIVVGAGGLPIHSNTVDKIKELVYPMIKRHADESTAKWFQVTKDWCIANAVKCTLSMDGAWGHRGHWSTYCFVPMLVSCPSNPDVNGKVIMSEARQKSRYRDGKPQWEGDWDQTSATMEPDMARQLLKELEEAGGREFVDALTCDADAKVQNLVAEFFNWLNVFLDPGELALFLTSLFQSNPSGIDQLTYSPRVCYYVHQDIAKKIG